VVQLVGPAPSQVAQVPAQAEQTRSAVAEQAALSYWPAGHAPEQPRHAPPLRYLPPPHVAHAEDPAPVHVTQVASQAAHTRSADAEQAELWYWPARHAPEQATHVSGVPATRYSPD
jgi:hypothetical protein